MRQQTRYTHQPRPETLDPVPRRRLVVGVGLDLFQAGDEVHLLGPHEWCAEVELRANVEDGEQRQGDVVRDERIGLPLALEEYGPPRELSDKGTRSVNRRCSAVRILKDLRSR